MLFLLLPRHFTFDGEQLSVCFIKYIPACSLVFPEIVFLQVSIPNNIYMIEFVRFEHYIPEGWDPFAVTSCQRVVDLGFM